MKKANDHLMSELRSVLLLEEVPHKYKSKASDFTRKRKLSFPRLVTFLCLRVFHSLNLELHRFFEKLALFSDPILAPSPSAFCQQRAHLKASFFEDAFTHLVREFYTDNDERVRLWGNFRLLAVDGSSLRLPKQNALREIYGSAKNKQGPVQVSALASLSYDIRNHMVVAARLDPYECSEKVAALHFLDHYTSSDLLLYDRGYPGFDFIYQHHHRGLSYLMRLKANHSGQVKDFVASGKKEQLLDLAPDQSRSFKDLPYDRHTRLKVRLLRIPLESGEDEFLISSLLEKERYPYSIFGELYEQRWGVETHLDLLKNTLELESFSGKSPNTIQQEFYIVMLAANIAALYREEIQKEIDQKYQKRKYRYQVNMRLAIGRIRDYIPAILLSPNPEPSIRKIKDLLIKYPAPIRPKRKVKRGKKQRRFKKKIPYSRKPVL